MEIRPGSLVDVDAVVALVESAYRGESSRAGWTTEADLLDGSRTDATMVTHDLPHLLVAYDGETLLGCCVLEPRGDHGYFGMFAVVPTLQGGGVGSALLAAAEARALLLGLTNVEMTVLDGRRELIDYYLRRGYVDTGQRQPFPYGEARFGLPRTNDLAFTVLSKELASVRME